MPRVNVAIIAPRDEPGRVHVAHQTQADFEQFPELEQALGDHVRPLKARPGGARRLLWADEQFIHQES